MLFHSFLSARAPSVLSSVHNLKGQELLTLCSVAIISLFTPCLFYSTCILPISINMRITESFARLGSRAYHADYQREERQRRRSSFDTLVIPNRTRLPSSQLSQVEPIDLQIAMHLLNAQAPPLPTTHFSHPVLGPPQRRQNTDEMTAAGGEEQSLRPATPDSFSMLEAEDHGPVYIDNNSAHPHHSGPGNHRTGDSTASPYPLRFQPDYPVNEYNALAMTHGINPITVIDDCGQSCASFWFI